MRHGIKNSLLLFTFLTLIGCSKLPSPSNFGKAKLNTIAFYNTENLFDTSNDPKTADDAFTPEGSRKWTQERYQAKLKELAKTIGGIAGDEGPAVVGLSEVENLKVVEDLINTSPLKKYNYNIIHFDSPGGQGLDLALLYRPKVFKPSGTASIPVNYRNKNVEGPGILQVKGELRGELVTIYVNQWPTPNRRRKKVDETQLKAAANTLRREINKQQKGDPNSKIIVMGDFEIEPRANVMQQVLKANGRPNPYYDEELFNTHYLSFVNGLGTSHYRGDFKVVDQIMISKSLLDEKGGLQYVRGSAGIHDPVNIKYTLGKYKETPKSTYNGNLYLGGISDHFPVYIQVRKDRR